MKLVLSKWFTPDGAPDEFGVLLRGLSVSDWETVTELAGEGSSTAVTDHLIECGVLDWRGVEMAEGQPLAYSPDEFKRLPFQLMEAVVDRIIEISRVDEKTEKNSSSQSTSPRKKPAARSTAKTASTDGTATKPTRRRSRPSA